MCTYFISSPFDILIVQHLLPVAICSLLPSVFFSHWMTSYLDIEPAEKKKTGQKLQMSQCLHPGDIR